MKIQLWALLIENRHGRWATSHAGEDDAYAHAARYVRERYCDQLEPSDLRKPDRELVNYTLTCEFLGPDDGNIELRAGRWMEIAPPVDPVAAAQMAVDALALARDCLKVAQAPRTLDRVRRALSSAKGAVRATGYRQHRQAEHEARLRARSETIAAVHERHA